MFHVSANVDELLTMLDVDAALNTFGNGVGTAGISKDIIHLFPAALREMILLLMQRVFLYELPKQILHAIPKQ